MRASLFACILLALAAAPPPARADEPWQFVQVTCVKELGYFAVRRFTVMNLPKKGPYLTEGLDPGPAAVEAVRRHNIFDAGDIKDRPIDCEIAPLPAIMGWGARDRPGFKVKVIGHLDRDSNETSYCRIANHVEVFVDNKRIGGIGLNPCAGNLTESINVAHNGVENDVEICTQSSIFEVQLPPNETRINCVITPLKDFP